MKRLLPIGIQDFSFIREEGFCYVDKTARIHQLTLSKKLKTIMKRWFIWYLQCSALIAALKYGLQQGE